MSTSMTRVAAAALATAVVGTAATALAIELRQVSRPQDLHGQTIVSYHTPAWSSDGGALVASAGFYSPLEQIGVLIGIDLDGNLLEWPAGYLAGWQVGRPSIDPTQARVAFYLHANLSVPGVFVAEVGSYGVPVSLLEFAFDPAWSPDGQTILVATGTGLQAVPSSGGEPHPVTMRADDGTPAWSPDGSRIVFSSTLGGTRDLWIKDMASGALRQLTDDAAEDSWPAWSPNGRWIAFASDRAGTFDIWAVRATGGSPVLIAGPPSRDLAPAWSPDGTAIAFGSDQPVWGHIWIATVLPDYIIAVEPTSWSRVKTLYGDGAR